MLSRLQKLSKDMILYSVILSDFEKPDFKNDALAGVRANYFNSNHCAQSDTTEIELDGRQLSLSYSMKEGEPISWKITKNHQPYQSVRRGSASSYCVMTYSDNGVVYKRAYFDSRHIWQRTDYFHQEKENQLLACVSPRMSDGLLTLRVEKFAEDGTRTRATLYPSENHGGIKCAALVYSNAGMLWYDVRFAPTSFAGADNVSEKKGFSFTSADFSAQSDKPLDLENAAALSEEDIVSASAEVTENIPEEERPYSAYDRIESILLELSRKKPNRKFRKSLLRKPLKKPSMKPQLPRNPGMRSRRKASTIWKSKRPTVFIPITVSSTVTISVWEEAEQPHPTELLFTRVNTALINAADSESAITRTAVRTMSAAGRKADAADAASVSARATAQFMSENGQKTNPTAQARALTATEISWTFAAMKPVCATERAFPLMRKAEF